jgi:hypothetical protein
MGLLSKLVGGSKQSSSSGPPTEQMPFLKNMWSNAQNMQNYLTQNMGLSGGAAGGATPQGNSPWRGGYGGSQGSMPSAPPAPGTPGGAYANTGGNMPAPYAYANQLSDQGVGNLQSASTAMNPFAQQGYGGLQMAGLTSLLNNNLQTNMLPGIRDAANMAGGFGGSGMGIAQGQAMGDTNRALFEGAGNIMQTDLQRRQDAAYQGGQLNLGAAQQLPGMYDLRINQPMNSMFLPLVTQGGINQGYNSSTSSGTTNPGVGGLLQGGGSAMAGYAALCAVARLVFGEDNPEWVTFYQWKEAHPAFKWVYDRTCIPVAAWLADKPRLQAGIRRWMRWVVKE